MTDEQWPTAEAIRALIPAGVHATVRSATSLNDQFGRVLHISRDTRPSRMRNDLAALDGDDRMVYIVPDIKPKMLTVAQADPRVIAVSPNGVILGGNLLPAPELRELQVIGRGPKPYARFALVRALLSPSRPSTQNDLSVAIGVSQQAVSHALRGLGANSVYRSITGWTLASPTESSRWAIENYPGPGGVVTYWWHSDELEAQYQRVAGVVPDVLLSGDLAADRISSWRKPQHVTLYSMTPVDPARLGFAMATKDDYSLSLTLPGDPTLWATAAAYARPGIADPLVVAYDVRATGTTGDQDEAAERILSSVNVVS